MYRTNSQNRTKLYRSFSRILSWPNQKDPAKTCEDVKKFIWYTSHYLSNFTEEKLPVKARTLEEAKDIAYYFACDKGDYKNQVYDIVIAVCMLESKDDLKYVISKLEELVQMM